MPTSLEVAKTAIDDFAKIQRHMLIAKEEGATKTYASLKDDYLSLKAILNVSGVDLTDIDKIKEYVTIIYHTIQGVKSIELLRLYTFL